MAEVADDALLLRRIPYSDSSLVCHFLTSRHGRVTLMARGARRAKSPFRATLAPLYEMKISWRPGRAGMGTLVDVDRGRKLLDERLDLDGLELCAVASRLFHEGDPHGYEELLEVLGVLQHAPVDSALCVAVWKLLLLTGWLGDLGHCWHCGEQVDERAVMSWQGCQLVCSSCRDDRGDGCGRGMVVSAGMRKGLEAQLHHAGSGANVRLSRDELSSWQQMIQDVLRQHGVRPLTDFLGVK